VSRNGSKLLLAVILLASTCLYAYAQEPYLQFSRVSGDESVSNVDILDIEQDEQGFLWFATRGHGVVRYDGYEFRVFRSEQGNPGSLSRNEASRINIDSNGTMRVSTPGGIEIFDPATMSFELINDGPPDNRNERYTNATVVDQNGTVWAATGDGLFRKDKDSSEFRSYDIEPQSPSGWMPWFAEHLLVDSRNTLWVATLGGGLLRYEAATDSFTRFMHDPDDPDSIADNHVTYLYEDSLGAIWISTDGGLSRKDVTSDRFLSYFNRESEGGESGSNVAGPVLEDSYGIFWVAIENEGIYLLDRESGSHLQFAHDPDDPNSLSSNTVYSLFEDNSGVIWIGSDSVNRLVPGGHAFAQIRNPVSNVGTHGRVANAMIQSRDGAIWLDGMEGVDRYDPATGAWQRFTLFSADPASPANEVTATYEDRVGNIWLGHPKNVSKIDMNDGSHSSIEVPSAPVDILVDRAGNEWVALPMSNAFSEMHFADGTIRLAPFVDYFEGQSASKKKLSEPRGPFENYLSHAAVRDLQEDRTGAIWVGTYSGLNRRDPDTGKFVHYYPSETDFSTVSSKRILSIFEDARGSIWFGSEDGLNLYKPSSDNFQRYYNGSSGRFNRIYDIEQGEGDRLWLSSAGGLSEFDPASGTFTNYDRSDGMPALFGQSIVHDAGSGLIYLATSGGLVTMDPSKIESASKGPAIALTDFRLQNRSVTLQALDSESPLKTSITTTKEMTLGPEHSIISFGFSALDYVDPTKNQYMYRLEGFDQDWIQTEADRRFASYTNLPAGNFIFRVKAANSAGVWNQEGISLNLTVLPPWWQTNWAYLAYVILTLSMITGFIQLRTRTLSLRKAALEDEVRERTVELSNQKQTIEEQAARLQNLIEAKNRYITNISHEFRTPLTVILGPIERLYSRDPESRVDRYLDAVQRNASRLLRLVDKLLGLSQAETIKTYSAVPQPVPPVVRHVVASIEALATEKEIVIETDLVQDVWVMCTEGALEEIVVNLLSNALKYTHFGGAISIEAESCDDGMVRIAVSDNGPGIAESDQEGVFDRFYRGADLDESIPGSGLGLALVNELVTVNGGTINLESELGQGTRVELFLPAADNAPESQEFDPVSTAAINEANALNIRARDLEQRPSDAIPQVVVIEDNLDLCEHVGEILARDFQCTFAHDGQSGLAIVTEAIPDLVLCDVMLPKINGFEVTRQIKHDDRTCHIPVILLTALADESSRIRGLKELADAYITKPFGETELLQSIETILSIREILRQRFSKDIQLGSDDAIQNSFVGKDKRFVEHIEYILEQNFSNPEFSTADFAKLMNMGERQLQRKLKALMNYTPTEYLRDYRLRQAMAMLADGLSASETSFRVGFQSHSYFGKCFKARFGMTPSEAVGSRSVGRA
jgi:signal transduction histidine kinase/ligand-binding sensor domain-containing protein/DNA-binding response OmpR family regulator